MSETEKRPVGRPVTTGTTPKRGIRIPDDLWSDITAAAKAQGTDAAAVTRDFYAWYVRRPGAKMPKRPAPALASLEERTNVRKGDQFLAGENNKDSMAVPCVVTDVAEDGAWADLTYCTGLTEFSRRLPLPLPESFRRLPA